ncbi:hypothetical protein PWG14_03725 (plasmid) [Chromobacterium amazonense]|nr:hypothetical protein [Chromobacterium amazonense]MDE1711883.1 hypothetical protein [Chromobacterium amazonense]
MINSLELSLKRAETPRGCGPYGVDAGYFDRKLARIIPALDNYKPADLAREFARMAAVADRDAARAELLPATEQSGEAVAWVDVVDSYEGPYNFHGKELLPVGRHPLYTRRQPSPAVPEEWRDAMSFASAALAEAIQIASVDRMPPMAGMAMQQIEALLAAAPQPAQQMPTVIEEIAAERRRQIEVEGWTPEHDALHCRFTLSTAAGCYAMHAHRPANDPPSAWPWDKTWWKPSADLRRNWIKAAALLVAEIEREDRMAAPQPKEGGAA